MVWFIWSEFQIRPDQFQSMLIEREVIESFPAPYFSLPRPLSPPMYNNIGLSVSITSFRASLERLESIKSTNNLSFIPINIFCDWCHRAFQSLRFALIDVKLMASHSIPPTIEYLTANELCWIGGRRNPIPTQAIKSYRLPQSST